MEDSGEEEDSVVDLPDSVIIDCCVRVNIEHLDNENGQGAPQLVPLRTDVIAGGEGVIDGGVVIGDSGGGGEEYLTIELLDEADCCVNSCKQNGHASSIASPREYCITLGGNEGCVSVRIVVTEM